VSVPASIYPTLPAPLPPHAKYAATILLYFTKFLLLLDLVLLYLKEFLLLLYLTEFLLLLVQIPAPLSKLLHIDGVCNSMYAH
jgi:hypothetical protein